MSVLDTTVHPMNADLTINSIVFAKSYDKEDGSKRTSNARGVNTLDILTIKRQDAVQSDTKLKQKRFNVRTDRENIDAVTGQKYRTSIYTVIEVSELSLTADVDAIVATHRALIASTSPNYITQVLNNE